MGILNWVHNKFNGKQEKKRPEAGSNSFPNTSIPEFQKDELNDWPQGFLSIGTLGNQEINEEIETEEERLNRDSCISRDYSQGSQEYSRLSQEYSRASQDLPDFTIEEVKKLQEVLTKLLKRKPKSGEEEKANLPLDRFLNCPSSLEVERTVKKESNNNSDDDKNEIGDLSPHTKMILCKARDLLVNDKNTMKQKSLKFLLKKLFVCGGGGFMPKPSPSLRDPIPESRMDKLFRTVLQKKMFSRSTSTSSRKKFLENKAMENRGERDGEDRGSDRHKWVKTDSEYIVLEI
ncbi:UDP-N-acetylenolpyruvoylglucosamine reductase [Rhynchospora pubera]|uniref:UDP-N-acetylenolpyruvoylglucosamine reductase n=1 Tax=Rhynchospora pubera TaxID=906938 RepID=A0AAV8FDQ9_9POAL|nr:UDP-N-acetylenolpyruvoylglucosamine reductase [Rhynchospora pubera]